MKRFLQAMPIWILLLLGSFTFAQQASVWSGRPSSDQTLRVAVHLVMLDVSVTDDKGRFVRNLGKESFQVYEDKVQQPITFFSSETAPVTWGLVVDRSGSMSDMKAVYDAAAHMIDEGTGADEMFLMTFSGKIDSVSDLTLDRRVIQNAMFGLHADGTTALWDSLNSGIDHLKNGKHRKKALLLITDGQDNRSVLTFKRILDRVRESDFVIYTVGINTPSGTFAKGSAVRDQLAQLAEITGGYAHFPTDIEKCKETMSEISREVSEQYAIGYYPTNSNYDGQWRKLRVVVTQPGTHLKYIARTRSGYYAMQAGK